MRRVAATFAALACLAAARPLPDADQEARARAMFREVRCVVCQNESIDESQADLASDLRVVVRQQISEGRTDDEVRAFLVARYGEFVLFRPAFSLGNAMLWLAPFAVVAVGGVVLVARQRSPGEVAPLNAEESLQLQGLTTAARAEPDRPNLT